LTQSQENTDILLNKSEAWVKEKYRWH
jgi:hypothetical protein